MSLKCITTMAEQVDSIRLFSNGYAFLNDAKGNIFFHPRFDVALLTEDTMPKTPDGIVSESTFLRYTFEGVEKRAAWLPLCNGMRLTVSVPTSEKDDEWQALIRKIVVIAILVLLVLSFFTLYYTGRITRSLEELTLAAEQVKKGNFDFELQYSANDEIGRLTETFKHLTSHVKDHIIDLNKRVYVDALTSVKNKGAFADAIDALQARLDGKDEKPVFAIGIFDCDNLKSVNDQYGHGKGDAYLKNACRLICRVFQHSPVFRIGGDEFAVILQNEDFDHREALVSMFQKDAEKTCAANENPWEQVQAAIGVAVFDPRLDRAVLDTVHRADKLMYENKQKRKVGRGEKAGGKH